ncbi:Crp/Fnr family transcriptional regulator [Paraclostridium bifermentans]|uniref:Crp/Fnr family transcriptional regulator n=1 Tax=Paraclostridium bifermentans TaxID=1490 RepID=UPI001FF2C3C6|nr:Crp/Fnr family transcriptional regulator [Paraclostridium bifermentans]MDM8128597.1 Crp/Fnr family transcriptional regulator [Paraclostridium benzoelyticum]UOW69562.1 Crp/Fnr family transcriptional regulator [Paraclostridium bifermentans]
MRNLINDLKKSSLFKNKSSEELETLINSINYKIIKLKKNETVFDVFSLTNSIGLVLSGELTVEKILPCGKLIVLFHKLSGEIFGEVAVFSNAKEYPCNVIAKTECKVILFTREELFKLITLDNIVLNNFLYLISSKAYYLNSKVESLSFTSVRQKIAHSLIRDFNVCKDNDFVKLSFSKKVWADNLNISRASLYRELYSLCNDLIITINDTNVIKILDFDRLNSILLD